MKFISNALALGLFFALSSASAAEKMTLVCTYNKFRCCPSTYIFDLEKLTVRKVGESEKWNITSLSDENITADSRESKFDINRITGEITHGELTGSCRKEAAKF